MAEPHHPTDDESSTAGPRREYDDPDFDAAADAAFEPDLDGAADAAFEPDLHGVLEPRSQAHFDAAPRAAEGQDVASATVQSGSAVKRQVAGVERVRFAVPATLSFDGYADTFAVSVLNLSEQGVACTGPQGLAAGDRLRLQFPLSLADTPQRFLCQVVWVQAISDEDANYGLRFVDLADAAAQRIREAVRERAEGRAAEWPLPPPNAEPDTAIPALAEGSHQPVLRPWLAALAGMAAGVAFTLLVGAIFVAFGSGAPQPAAVVSSAIETPEVRPGDVDELPSAAAPPPSQVAEAPSAAQSPQGPPPSAQPAASPTKVRKIGLLELTESADGAVALTLLADGPVGAHRAFWLQNPPRLVVDIDGRQSGFASKIFEIDHDVVRRMRVGQHPKKVRYVIETSKDTARDVVTTPQDKALRVVFRRGA